MGSRNPGENFVKAIANDRQPTRGVYIGETGKESDPWLIALI